MIRLSLHDQFREKDAETKLNMIFQYLMATDRKVAKICQYIDHERGAGGFQTASTADESATETPSTPEPVVEKPKPKSVGDSSIAMKLAKYSDELDFSEAPEILKPKKFMGDRWQGVMDILKVEGYAWVRDGKNSRWEFGEQVPYTKDLSGFGKSAETVDVSEIDWKVKDEGETVNARSGEKAWAHVMGWDRDKSASTGNPKRSTQALHDYLQQKDHYCDGEYVYTMNAKASFFSRDPMP